MGGVARKIGEEIKRPFSQDRPAITQIIPGMEEAIKKASEKTPLSAAEDVAARRRARRGGRALLSEQRLTPEAGVGQSTLGSGPSI